MNDLIEKINADAAKVKPLPRDFWGSQIPQHILWLKMVLSSSNCKPTQEANNAEKKHYSEDWVNLAMTYAYFGGSTDINQRSFDAGYAKCRQDMLTALGVEDEIM